MKKIIFILLLVFLVSGCNILPLVNEEEVIKDVVNQVVDDNQELIGGQRDEHGCLGPAGYSWDEEIQACLRTWELDENQRKAAKIAVEYQGPAEGLTLVEVLVARCPGCFTVNLENNGERYSVALNNWVASTVNLDLKTYINTEFGYQIDYPVDWPIEEKANKDIVIGNVPWEPSAGALTIKVMEDVDLGEYIKLLKENYVDGCEPEISLSIAGQDSTKLVCIEAFAGGIINNYFVQYNEMLYSLIYIEGNDNINSIFEKMVESFQFIE